MHNDKKQGMFLQNSKCHYHWSKGSCIIKRCHIAHIVQNASFLEKKKVLSNMANSVKEARLKWPFSKPY